MTDKAAKPEQENNHAIDADELESIAAEASADEAPESAGELVDEDHGPSTAEVLEPLISFACDLSCPNYRIQKQEKKALSESYGDLVDKYFPDGIGAWGVELNALLVTAAIFGPRVAQGIPAHAKPEKAGAQQEREPETHEG